LKVDYKTIVFLIIIVLFLSLVIHYRTKTWDDSAITLGFSRNLVKYGDIIPSQYSDRVEGYSTFLWMLINTIPFRLSFDEDASLVFAKAFSALLTFINIWIFWKLSKERIHNSFYQIMALLFFTLSVETLTAAVFGMETALYATLVMLSFIFYRQRDQSAFNYALFTAATSLLILIRQEGILFLLPFVIDNFLIRSKLFWKEPFLYTWVIIFLIYQIWHYSFFGEILTNPMIAKEQWPYRPVFSSAGVILQYYLSPFIEFISRYFFLFALLVIYCIRFKKNNALNVKNDDKSYSIINWIVVTGIFVMLITGDSWNAAERLSYPALAFIFLSAFSFIDRVSFASLILNSKLAIVVAFFAFIFGIFTVFTSFITPQFIITIDSIRSISNVVTLTQKYLQRTSITYAAPDMGGLMLYYGDGKRIIDIGLLCNKELARTGFTELDEYLLQKEHPEIIEIHDEWVEPFLTSRLFVQKYFPVRVLTNDNERFLFIRQDIVAEIIRQNRLNEITLGNEPGISPILYAMLSKYGKYIILDLRSFQTMELNGAK
jgi:hypothetical protein